MSRRRILLLTCLVLATPLSLTRAEPSLPVSSTPVARASPAYSLDHCIRTALANNPALILAEQDLALARSRHNAATAGLFPAVSLKAEETRGKADLAAQTPSFVERHYGVQVTQPLFYGGRKWSLHRQSRLRMDSARLQREKQRNDLHHQIAEAYWRVVHLEEARRHHKETCVQLQEDLEKASRRELGPVRAARIELLSTRAQSRECEIQLEETGAELLQARNRLLDIMGHRNVFDYEVGGPAEGGPIEIDEEECVRLANRHRSELALAEAAEEAAQWGRRAARGLYSPRVDANGFYGRSGAAFDETEPFEYQKDWNAGVKVSWSFLGNTAAYSAAREKTSPKLGESSRTETETQAASFTLGDSFQNAVETRESRRNLWQEQWRLDQTRREIEQDSRLASRKVSAAWKRLEMARTRLEQALQEFRDVRNLLEEDRAHLGDMAAARNRIAAARTGQAQATADYHSAVSNLNRAIGIAGHFQSGTAPQ